MRLKRIIAVFLAVMMVFAMMPSVAVQVHAEPGDSGTPLASDVVIYVQGTKVTTENQTDVFGDQTVSFNSDTMTLTLENADLTVGEDEGYQDKSAVWIKASQPVTILLEGDNKITANGVAYYYVNGICSDAGNIPITIKGPGSLDISLNNIDSSLSAGLAVDGALTISEGADVRINSSTGINFLHENLLDVQSGSKLEMTCEEEAFYGAGFTDDTKELGVQIGAEPYELWDGTSDINSKEIKYIRIPGNKISATATFRVVNGAWNDGTRGDKTVPLEGYVGEALKLAESDIPITGNNPDNKFKAGSWDVTPDAETEITEDTIYTYTYVAAEPAPAMNAGPAALNKDVNTGSAQTLWYADKTWRVVGYDGNGAASESNAATLLSSGNLILTRFISGNNTSNVYADSKLRKEIYDIEGSLSSGEQEAIVKKTLLHGTYNGVDTDCIAGEEDITDNRLWPLSTKEANAVDPDIRRLDPGNSGDNQYRWWLRSPGIGLDGGHDRIADVSHLGDVIHEGDGGQREIGVRPAFNLKLDDVLFTSAAVGGKTSGAEGADALKSQTGQNNNAYEWKVTLRSGHGGFKTAHRKLTENSVSVDYADAKVGTNEYISAVITDKPVTDSSAKITYYGRIQECESASGTVTINIAGKLGKNDHLYIFNEQYNGDKKTDYASALQEVSIPESAPAMNYGAKTLEQNVNTGDAQILWYGDNDWYVIGYNGNGAASGSGAASLMSVKTVDQSSFSNNSSRVYAGSALQSSVDALAGTLSDPEQAAVVKKTLKTVEFDFDNTDGVMGDPVENAVLWPLTTKEAHAVAKELRIVDPLNKETLSNYWWLCSPGGAYNMAALVDGFGDIYNDGYNVDRVRGVRPGFDLDLDSVLFTSAAAGGKTSGAEGADALKSQSGQNNNTYEWKVTLRSGHGDFKIAESKPAENSVTVKYTGAAAGTAEKPEYISAIITDKPVTDSSAKITYYGRIQECTSESGTVTINFADKLGKNDHLYIFNEQYNGDKKTDYASELLEVSIPRPEPDPTPTPDPSGDGDDPAPTPTPTPDPSGSGDDPAPEKDQKGKDGTAVGPGASAAVAEKAIMNASSDEGPKGTKYSPLKLKSTKQTKSSVKLTWTKSKKAKKYVIYGNLCGKKNKMKKIANATGKSRTIKKIAGKKLKKGKYYKFIIVALDKNNKVVSTSKVVHVATKGGKVGNHKSVTVKKTVITKAKKLKKGKTLKLNAKAVKASKKTVKIHRSVRYQSSNTKIATVSSKGVVKGKKKGTCYIYAYAQNGVAKKIKIVVK